MNKRSLFPMGSRVPDKVKSLAVVLTLMIPGLAPADSIHSGKAANLTGHVAIPDRTVRGTVTDEKGDGLPGVNILVKGTQRGIITDSNGNFLR